MSRVLLCSVYFQRLYTKKNHKQNKRETTDRPAWMNDKKEAAKRKKKHTTAGVR